MGVLEPLKEVFEDQVPATPPGAEDSGEDDLFSETESLVKHSVISYGNDLSFRNILPVLPAKGDFGDLIGENIWELQTQPYKEKKYCSGCVEDVKKDLQKLAKVVEDYRNEKIAARQENEALKKEVEQLKKLLKQKEDGEKGDVKVTVSNWDKDAVDVLVRKKLEGSPGVFSSKEDSKNKEQNFQQQYGVQSFSVSIPQKPSRPVPAVNDHQRVRKSVAELRREFFAKEFQSEQKTFTSSTFLEIKPEEKKKKTLRSRLAISAKPKQRIVELISKLTSKVSGPKVIPEVPPVSMFQRFEKTRVVWENQLDVA